MLIETPRLGLRELVAGDARFVLELLNDPDWVRFIGDRGVRTVEGAAQYITSGPMESYARHGFGLFLTEVRDGGAPAGLCGLIKRDTLPDVDIGYAFLPRYRGLGYAVEACEGVLRFAKETVALARVAAITDPTNVRSIAVLAKLGLTFERMIRLSEDDIELSFFARSL